MTPINFHKKEKPLTSLVSMGGGATGLQFGGAAAGPPYIDDVFHTQTFVSTNSNAEYKVTNNLDNSGEGGLVWYKQRNGTSWHLLWDTERGSNKYLYSNEPDAQSTGVLLKSFDSDGYTIKEGTTLVDTSRDNVLWNFRKAKGFFDVVKYTGNGTGGRTVSHNLGCVPGMIILKNMDSSNDWVVGHSHIHSSSPWSYRLQLDTNVSRSGPDSSPWNYTAPTSTEFTLGNHDRENKNGDEFIAYIFADESSKLATSRSVDFAGSSDYLLSTSSDYSPGTGDFTMEAWVSVDSISGNATDGIYQLSDSSGAFKYGGIALLYKRSGSENRWELYGGNSTNVNESAALTGYEYGRWVHTAIVKTAGNIKLYINGEERISTADTQNYANYQYLGIGAAFASNYSFNGRVSNFKLTIGQALYTSAFTPTNQPLTTTSQSSTASNVKILCCNNSSITGKTVGATITSNGTVTASEDTPNFIDPDTAIFGEDEDKGAIKCGSYVGNGGSGGDGPEINLGWEPQWILVKRATGGNGDWRLFDSMRGISTGGNDAFLGPNESNAEYDSGDYVTLTPTGFQIVSSAGNFNANGDRYVYIAIRRPDGYVGKPPESATDVFTMATGNSSNNPSFTSNFPVDFALNREPASGNHWRTSARLIRQKFLNADNGDAESSSGNYFWDFNNGAFSNSGWGSNRQAWMWKRGQSFDVVTWTGNGTLGKTVYHNLGRPPEMIWVKNRTDSNNWYVGHMGLNSGVNPWTKYIDLNLDAGEGDYTVWNDTPPTSTYFQVGHENGYNGSNKKMIAFLFATVSGISKVGRYAGTGSTLTIPTGFQPKFIIIRSTSSSRNWLVFDTLRGWAVGNDQELNLNKSDAQGGNNDFGAPTATGFTANAVNDDINASGHNYIYYAHA